MKDRIVIWGQNEKDEDILIAIRLLQDSDIIRIWTFPKKDTDAAFVDQIFQEWKEGAEDLFPQPHQLIERGISEESLLPESIKTPKTDVIKIAEQEWRVRVLSFRLYQHIKQQIEQLDTRAANLSLFSKDVWQEAKDVSKSIKENTLDRNIKKRQTTELRNSLDVVFDKLKKLQNAEQEKFLDVSKGHLGDFRQKINEIITQIGKGNAGKKLFDQLVQFQNEVKGIDMTIRDRNALRLNFNEAFEALKANRQSSFGNRMTARVNGLKSAIGKMEVSIKRDKENVTYQSGRINKNTTTQLEYQLRSAKLKLIEDRIHSKEQKLHNMYLTLKDLEKKAGKAISKAAKVVLPGKGKKTNKQTGATANQVAESKGGESSKEAVSAEKSADVKTEGAVLAVTPEVKPTVEKTDAREQVVEAKTEKAATDNEAAEKAAVVEKPAVAEPATEVKAAIVPSESTAPENEAVVEKVEATEQIVEKKTEEVLTEPAAEVKAEVVSSENTVPKKEAIVEKVEATEQVVETKIEEAVTEKLEVPEPVTDVKEAIVASENITSEKEPEVEKPQLTAPVEESINKATEQLSENVENEKKPEEELIISKITNVADEAKGKLASIASVATGAFGLSALTNENTSTEAEITGDANSLTETNNHTEKVSEHVDSVDEKTVDQTDNASTDAVTEEE